MNYGNHLARHIGKCHKERPGIVLYSMLFGLSYPFALLLPPPPPCSWKALYMAWLRVVISKYRHQISSMDGKVGADVTFKIVLVGDGCAGMLCVLLVLHIC